VKQLDNKIYNVSKTKLEARSSTIENGKK